MQCCCCCCFEYTKGIWCMNERAREIESKQASDLKGRMMADKKRHEEKLERPSKYLLTCGTLDIDWKQQSKFVRCLKAWMRRHIHIQIEMAWLCMLCFLSDKRVHGFAHRSHTENKRTHEYASAWNVRVHTHARTHILHTHAHLDITHTHTKENVRTYVYICIYFISTVADGALKVIENKRNSNRIGYESERNEEETTVGESESAMGQWRWVLTEVWSEKVGWLRGFAQVKSEKHYERKILMVSRFLCAFVFFSSLLLLVLCLLLLLMVLLLLCFGFDTKHKHTHKHLYVYKSHGTHRNL